MADLEGWEEVLGCINEECGEVTQVVGKIMRHGFEAVDTHVTGDGRRYDNLADLHKECGDVLGAIYYAFSRGLLDKDVVIRAKLEKIEKLARIHG